MKNVRVALVSCYDKHNYGSMLQAWATQEHLRAGGFDVRTIDKGGLTHEIGAGRREHYARHALDAQMYAEKVPFALHRARQRISPTFGVRMRQRHEAFERFAKRRFRLSRRTFSFEEARALSAEYDVAVVGSDQLWLPVNVAGDYFTLSWVDPAVRKVSYATSLGVSELDAWASERMGEFLLSYAAVSVREKAGADLVKRAAGVSPEVVCDPTMLLDRQQWSVVINRSYAGKPQEPYLLTYFLGRNAWHREAAARYARAHGLKVVAIAHNDSYVRADEGYADYYPWDAGPAEWLALVEGASLVCTDSFHGTVFSNILEVPFVSFYRHSGGGQSTNSRMDTLLTEVGQRARLCASPLEFEAIAEAPVDFVVSRGRIEALRGRSAEWLARALAIEGREGPHHIEVRHREDCCGCSACAASCPAGCISMDYDAEGCEYPVVDESRCVGCGACIRACPVINPAGEGEVPQRAFLVQHRDPQVLAESTSGGAMTALAQAVLSGGGVAFGAGYLRDDQLWRAGGAPGRLRVGHFGVEDEPGLGRFRNSKYVQSSMGPTFVEVRDELGAGREVLFTGTPCQCEGLLRFLGGRPPGLLVADVVCRATVCRAAFSSYQRWLDAGIGVADEVRFRDKSRYGYNYSNLRAIAHGADGRREVLYSAGVESDPYLRAFFSNLDDRPICYQCPFKRRYRQSDLTCWDCFDVARFSSALDDNRGVTRMLVHSEAGRELLRRASSWLRVEELDTEAAVEGVREMVEPVEANPRREAFMADVISMEPSDLVRKWLPDSPRVRAERLVRRVAQRTGAYDCIKRVAKRVLGK